MKPVFFIVFFLCYLSAMTQVQMDDELYDRYHDRLRAKFVLAKNTEGGGIPAAQWYPEMDCTNSWFLGTVCKNGYRQDQKGLLAFGDGTTFMAHYIAVLATEFILFTRKGKPVKQTTDELGIAMEALKRLDVKAELKYLKEGHENGFLLRDDVSYEAGRSINDQVGCVTSGAICKTGIGDGNVMSQDQSISLMFGLAFIIRLMPDTVLNPYSGVSFVTEAKNFIDRNIRYYARTGWVIKDPYGNDVPLGYSAVGYSYGIAKAASALTGKKYQNFISVMGGGMLWSTLNDTKYQPNNNLHNEVNLALQLYIMSITGMKDRTIFRSLCLDGHCEVFLLAESVLNQKVPDYSEDIFTDMLSQVPEKGTCCESPGCENAQGWMATNRWFHSTGRNGKEGYKGSEFNGLDVMLLYNLHQLVFR